MSGPDFAFAGPVGLARPLERKMRQTVLNFAPAAAPVPSLPPRLGPPPAAASFEMKLRQPQLNYYFAPAAPGPPPVRPRDIPLTGGPVPATYEEKRALLVGPPIFSQEQMLDNRLFYEGLWNKLHIIYPPSYFVDDSYTWALEAMWNLFHRNALDVQVENLIDQMLKRRLLVQSDHPKVAGRGRSDNDTILKYIQQKLYARKTTNELNIDDWIYNSFRSQYNVIWNTFDSKLLQKHLVANGEPLGVDEAFERIFNWQRISEVQMTKQWLRCMAKVGIAEKTLDEMRGATLQEPHAWSLLDKYIRELVLQITQMDLALAQEASNPNAKEKVLTHLLQAVEKRRQDQKQTTTQWGSLAEYSGADPKAFVLDELRVDDALSMVPTEEKSLLGAKLTFLKSAKTGLLLPPIYKTGLVLPPVYQRYRLPSNYFDFPTVFLSLVSIENRQRLKEPKPHLPQVAERLLGTLERCIMFESLDPFSRDIQNVLQVPAGRWESMRSQMASKLDATIDEMKSTADWDSVLQQFHQVFPPSNRAAYSYTLPLFAAVLYWTDRLGSAAQSNAFSQGFRYCFQGIFKETDQKLNIRSEKVEKLYELILQGNLEDSHENWETMQKIGEIAEAISLKMAPSDPKQRFVPIEPFYFRRKKKSTERLQLKDYADFFVGVDVTSFSDDMDVSIGATPDYPNHMTVPIHAESVWFIQRLERCVGQMVINGFSMAASVPLRNQLAEYVTEFQDLTERKERTKAAQEEKAAAQAERVEVQRVRQRQSAAAQAFEQKGTIFPIMPSAAVALRVRRLPIPISIPMPVPAAMPPPPLSPGKAAGPAAMQLGGASRFPIFITPRYALPPHHRWNHSGKAAFFF